MNKKNIFSLIPLSLLLIIVIQANAQNSTSLLRKIEWNTIITDTPVSTIASTLLFNGGAFLNSTVPVFDYYEKIKVNGSEAKASISGMEFQALTRAEINVLGDKASSISGTIQLKQEVGTERKINYLILSFMPLRKNPLNGSIEKVVGFTININSDQSTRYQKSSPRTYTSRSVLAEGSWHKIGLVQSGIYQINYEFLTSLGIAIDDIDPRTIRIYGNGAGMLPQANSKFRNDDLVENAIQIIGEQDGVFNTGDNILFYGEGAVKWNYDSIAQRFTHADNPYCDTVYYFITYGQGNGMRITNQSSSNQSPTSTVTSFNDYQLHEVDRFTAITENIKSGREWYGEDFEFNSSYDFNFSFPNIDASTPISVKTEVAAHSESISNFTVKVNNQDLYTIPCSRVVFQYDYDYASVAFKVGTKAVSSSDNLISVFYTKPDVASNGWLNYIEVNARRQLKFSGNQLLFRDVNSVGIAAISKFVISEAPAGMQVWDISNPLNPKIQQTLAEGSSQVFIAPNSSLKEYISFSGSGFLTPTAFGQIANQNLHGLGQAKMVIISHPDFISAAQRLADFRRTNDNMEVLVLTPEAIYNEFSSGKRDVTAFRDFMKMLYDRAGNDQLKMPKYLLLLGDGGYDNKGRKFPKLNFIPSYQSINSVSPLGSYVSDDYIALLDDNEGEYSDFTTQIGKFDLGIGRFPVQTLAEANDLVDKSIRYASAAGMGDWRNQITFIADDEDGNLHLTQAEGHASLVKKGDPNLNIDKIYFDAFTQVSTPGGSRYPDVTTAINQKMNSGTLVMNYTGHGGEIGWAHERVLGLPDINSWSNYNKMALIFTATCSFSRWDDPARFSAGELALLNNKGGAIALFTTTRVVDAGNNNIINQSFLKTLLDSNNVENKVTLGDLFMGTKNNILGGITINSRNFSFLGDPSVVFAFPRYKTKTTFVKDAISNTDIDTISSLAKVTISGIMVDDNGQKLENFNGIIYPQVYDKEAIITTLGQDNGLGGSSPRKFVLQENVMYKGKASVKNGDFSFTFIVPKDISFQVGKGRLSYYAADGSVDASGSDSIRVGGISSNIINDTKGPVLNVYLNDEKFVSGGMVNDNPTLHVKLSDENGINTVGNGIGHDIMATLTKEGSNNSTLVNLNQFYEAQLDSYQGGEIKYPLYKLAEGKYSLKVKAWDVLNNSSEYSVDFFVSPSEKLKLAHVLNYPNPFTTRTAFQFEHNRPGDQMDIQVRVFTVTGKLIKTIATIIQGPGTRVDNIFWDGRDEFGDRLGRGVYFYQLRVRSSDGTTKEQFEKLVILN